MTNEKYLPVRLPVYATQHYQGSGGVACTPNPSVYNWVLNCCVMLKCNRKFLEGYTSPELTVSDTSLWSNPYLDREEVCLHHALGSLDTLICDMIDDGWYVYFTGVDDYYVDGKSWFGEKHFSHDGLLTGYDRTAGTYRLCAYNQHWVYQPFSTPRASFQAGACARVAAGEYGSLFALKVTAETAVFSATEALSGIRRYLAAEVPGDSCVRGIEVQAYLARYLDCLLSGSIPYERMDTRVFRQLWEHKVCMRDRLRALESALALPADASSRYEALVRMTNQMRYVYAQYHLCREDRLPVYLGQMLHRLAEQERQILTELLCAAEKRGDVKCCGRN